MLRRKLAPLCDRSASAMHHPCCLHLTALATLAPPHFPLPRQTVEVVEELVRSYKGVLLVVSHGEGARCS